MNADSRRDNFLRVLRGESGKPSLFEPFICDTLAEQLIWRRGRHLWDDPIRYRDTMLSLRERTGADVVCVDTRRFEGGDRLRLLEGLTDSDADFIVLTDNADETALCDSIQCVAAVGGFGAAKKSLLPFIRMDGDIEKAIAENADGYFLPAGVSELYSKYKGIITLLGGLDASFIELSEPMYIYDYCEAVMRDTRNAGFAIGSGGMIGAEHYLSLISLLAVYRRYR